MQTDIPSPAHRSRLCWPWLFRTAARAASPVELLRAQLDQELTGTIVRWMILIGAPINFVFGLALWREITVVHRYPMTALANHVAGSVLTFGLGWLLLSFRRYRWAMTYIVVTSSLLVFLQIWTFQNSTIFVYTGLTLVLPSVVLPTRSMLAILVGLCLGLLLEVQVHPVLQRDVADWVSAMFTTVSISSALMIMGHSIRRVLDNFAAAVVAREQEAVRLARLEEHTKALEEHRQRLLAAQHDLRAPANTLLRTVQLVQAGAFDGPTARALLPQIELLVTRLRTRMDALFDEAKAPRLGARRDLPEIDLSSVIAAHLPELRRQAALAAVGQTPDRQPAILFEPCGPVCPIHAREDELQRILENLVLNSVAAGSRQIRLLLRPTGGDVEVIVEDTGKGFPEWMLQAPFRAMYSENKGGAGLGLAGVKANVEAFHGTLTLENWEEGARVRVCFPCASHAGPA